MSFKRKLLVLFVGLAVLAFLINGFGDEQATKDFTGDYDSYPLADALSKSAGIGNELNKIIESDDFQRSRSQLYDKNSGDFGFQFVRIKYDDIYDRRGRRRGRGAWATDWPTAEENLYVAIKRTTNLRIMGPTKVVTLSDKDLFNHSIVYITEPGYWQTNETEVENMKKYFARGGFMIIDDFHDFGGKGREWYNMYNNIKRVFEDREPVELTPDHPIWSIYYDIDPVEAESTKPRFSRYDDEYYGFFDDSGRMMAVICYNQDIGDGWEWPGRYLGDASTVSFQMAINFIIYALSH